MTDYKIQSGDNLTKIAKKFNLNVKDLIKQNGGKDLIFAGKTITIKDEGLAVEKTKAKPPESKTFVDKDGAKKIQEFDSKGKETSITEYDKSNKITKKTQTMNGGNNSRTTTYNDDGLTGKMTNYDRQGNALGEANVEVDYQGRITKGKYTDSSKTTGSFAFEYQKDGNILQTQYKADGKTVSRQILMDKNYNDLESTTFDEATGKKKETEIYNEYGNVVSTKKYDKNNKERSTNVHVVQQGETIDKLIRKSFEMKGIKPDSQSLEKAKARFIKDNPDTVKMTASGYHYLLSGTTVNIDGDIDADKKDKNNRKEFLIDEKTKEQVILTYDKDGTSLLKEERYFKDGSVRIDENFDEKSRRFRKATFEEANGTTIVKESQMDDSDALFDKQTVYDANNKVLKKYKGSTTDSEWLEDK